MFHAPSASFTTIAWVFMTVVVGEAIKKKMRGSPGDEKHRGLRLGDDASRPREHVSRRT